MRLLLLTPPGRVDVASSGESCSGAIAMRRRRSCNAYVGSIRINGDAPTTPGNAIRLACTSPTHSNGSGSICSIAHGACGSDSTSTQASKLCRSAAP